MKRKSKQAYWTRRVRAFEGSGQTRLAYCEPRGLAVHSLDYWRRRPPALPRVGFGRGPACVLLHDFGMQGAMWLPVIAPLPLKQCAFRRSRPLIPIEAGRVFRGMSAA